MNLGFSINTGFKLDVIDLSDATVVTSAGGTNSQTLTPPDNKIYQIVGISFSAAAPIGDTSGTHKLEVFYMGETSGGTYEPILIIGNHSTTINIGENDQFTGDVSEQPAGLNNQQKLMHQGFLWASNSYPITFKYTNSTDANQTGTRILKILVKVYNEL